MNMEELLAIGIVAFLMISLSVLFVMAICFVIWATVVSAADAVAAVNAERKKERK